MFEVVLWEILRAGKTVDILKRDMVRNTFLRLRAAETRHARFVDRIPIHHGDLDTKHS